MDVVGNACRNACDVMITDGVTVFNNGVMAAAGNNGDNGTAGTPTFQAASSDVTNVPSAGTKTATGACVGRYRARRDARESSDDAVYETCESKSSGLRGWDRAVACRASRRTGDDDDDEDEEK